jgi:nucleotide-binding universal stress UspA family protein
LVIKEGKMYKKILVPLDGSKLAECALSHAEEIARGCSAEEVILISVTERVRGQTEAPEAYEVYLASDKEGVGDTGSEVTVTLGKMQEQAQAYLARIEKALQAKGMRVRSDVPVGKPAEEIADFAKRSKVDIIVMSSHGRSGPSRWAYGSVTDKVLRSSCVPVLMVRAPGCVPGI